MFNERTFYPRNAAVYPIVFSLIDELQGLINPSAIHIGHDEVVGLREKVKGMIATIWPTLSKGITVNDKQTDYWRGLKMSYESLRIPFGMKGKLAEH